METCIEWDEMTPKDQFINKYLDKGYKFKAVFSLPVNIEGKTYYSHYFIFEKP